MSVPAPSGADPRARRDRARTALSGHGFDLLLATPGTNFMYLTGAAPHRMERLIAYLLPESGEPFFVCPAFEERNIRRDHGDGRYVTWGESDDPYRVLAAAVTRACGPKPRIGLEPTTWFWVTEKLRAVLPEARFLDAAALFEGLRSRKSADEVMLMARATELAEDAARKARLHLREGMTEIEAAEMLADEMRHAAAVHEPLVQFGDNSAIPHGAAGSTTLQRGDMVLFDLSAMVQGYLSDLSRMTSFGDATPRMKEIYRIVFEAQQAAIAAARPGVPCQEIDRAARRVIQKAGYGEYFLHRVGHGLGLDIHEPPYLVEGNAEPLAPGNVVTIEPGIYIAGEFGVRIEEVVHITETGAELLSDRQPALIETP